MKTRTPIQKKLALKLHKRAKILPGKFGLREISIFQSVLSDYRIIVIDFNAQNTEIYEGSRSVKKANAKQTRRSFHCYQSKKAASFLWQKVIW